MRKESHTGAIETDKREIYRYLGYRGSSPDRKVEEAVDSCLEELRQVVTPGSVYRQYPVERLKEDPDVLCMAGVEIRSRSLSRNLRDCGSVYLMAATLGMGPDRLIARASVGHMSRAVILQAAAAAMIEAWCDEIDQKIIEQAKKQGLCCRPRFSPGYGDFPLSFQRDLAGILRIQKEIGVSLTESLLLVPAKSVTAVIGLSAEEKDCVPRGCEVCARAAECPFSRLKI